MLEQDSVIPLVCGRRLDMGLAYFIIGAFNAMFFWLICSNFILLFSQSDCHLSVLNVYMIPLLVEQKSSLFDNFHLVLHFCFTNEVDDR